MSETSPQTTSPSKTRQPIWRRAAVFTVVATLVVAALVVQHRLAPKHFEVVEAGVLYRSATLRPENLEEVVERHGIRTVVNLRSHEENAEPWYAEQRQALARVGVEQVDLQMPRTTTPVAGVETRWLEMLADPAMHPILVHCQYGVLRTGIMVGVFELVHRDAVPAGLYERMPQFGHDVDVEVRAHIQGYYDGFVRRHGRVEAVAS